MELDTKISTKKIVLEFIVDETIIQAGSEYIYLVVAIKPKDKEIIGMSILKERNMFVAERFLSSIVDEYGQHTVSTKDGVCH
jgi:putative transposase